MDENKMNEIISKSKKDYHIFSYIKSLYKEEYFLNRNLMILSFGLSSMLTIKFIKSKIIYREFHGHFNSPQTLHNKRLTINYLSDAIFRFLLGNIFFFSSFYSFKVHYLKINEPLFPDKEKDKKDETQKILDSLEYSKDKKLMEVGIDKINENKHFDNKNITKLFEIKDSIKVRDNINKYYEKYDKK